jgi:DNA-binding LytR/AlgR family response regulator
MTIDPSLIRILTADDHPLLRKGIAALVNTEPDMKLIAEASNGQEVGYLLKFLSFVFELIESLFRNGLFSALTMRANSQRVPLSGWKAE